MRVIRMPASGEPGSDSSTENDRPTSSRPGAWARWWSRRVEVHERSMAPTLLPGDRLRFDSRAFAARTPVPGELVVAVDPEGSGRWVVKRVGRAPRPIPADTVWLEGDDAEVSRDSRQYGPVSRDRVLGKVWYRYAPPERRGVV